MSTLEMIVMCLCHLEESEIMENCPKVVIENNREPELFRKGNFFSFCYIDMLKK